MGKREKIYTEMLEWFVVLSVVAIIVLRIYAALFTQPVVSHDDKHYRGIAEFFNARTSKEQAVKDVFLPNDKHIGHRTVGYNSWIILFLKLFEKDLNKERIFQIANLVLYIIQAVIVYLLALWSTRTGWFSGALTFLYLSMPIAFGMNRWVMTENFIFPAVLCFSFFSVFIVSNKGDIKSKGKVDYLSKEILLPLMAAFVFGVFSTMREYALPSLLFISSAVIVSLLLQRRLIPMVIFSSVFYPYLSAALRGASISIRETVGKTGIVAGHIDSNVWRYYMPLSKWFYKLLFNSAGPAMVILFFFLLYFILKDVFTRYPLFYVKNITKKTRSGFAKRIFIGGLLIAVLAGIVVYRIKCPGEMSKVLSDIFSAGLVFIMGQGDVRIVGSIFILSMFAAYIIVMLAFNAYHIIKRNKKPRITPVQGGLYIFLVCFFILTLLYWTAACVSKVRFIRSTILPVISTFILLVTTLRILDIDLKKHIKQIKVAMVLLMCLSWGVLGFQLFFAYGGGKDFYVIPYKMPTFNHPLYLRKLEKLGDWHVKEETEEEVTNK